MTHLPGRNSDVKKSKPFGGPWVKYRPLRISTLHALSRGGEGEGEGGKRGGVAFGDLV